MKIINSIKVIILSIVIFNYSFAEINNKEINELILKLEQNLKTYEVTKASSLLRENIEIIDKFTPILNTIAKEDKIELYSSLTDNLDEFKANIFLKILSKDFENKSNLEVLSIADQQKLDNLLTKVVDVSYKNEKESHDGAYEIAKIISKVPVNLANNLVNITCRIAEQNNNSNNFSSNILYQINKIDPDKVNQLEVEVTNDLIKQSLKEVENEIVLKKVKVNNNINKENDLNIDALTAVSSAIISSNINLSKKITENIKNITKNKQEEVTFKLVEQTNALEEWNDVANKNVIESKLNFVEKVYPTAFTNIDLNKIDKAVSIVQSSDAKVANKTVEAIVNSYVENNNNFFKVDNEFLERTQDVFASDKINKTQFIKSNQQGELFLKSLYQEEISSAVFQDPQMSYIFSALPASNFALANVSPN